MGNFKRLGILMADGTLSSNFKEVAIEKINPIDAFMRDRLDGQSFVESWVESGGQSWGATTPNASLAQSPTMRAANPANNQATNQNNTPQTAPSPMETVRAALEAKPAPKVECGKAFNQNANPAQILNNIEATVAQTEAAIGVVADVQQAAQLDAKAQAMPDSPAPGGGVGGFVGNTIKDTAIGIAADCILPGAGLACAAFSAAARGSGSFATQMGGTDMGMGAANTGYSAMLTPMSIDRIENTSMTLRMDTLVLPCKTLEEAANDIHQMHNHACAMRDNMARLDEEGIVISDVAANAEVRAGKLDTDSLQRTAENHVRISAFGGGMQGMSGMM